jgi:ABC-type polysaccharide/polyol phosphate export permease
MKNVIGLLIILLGGIICFTPVYWAFTMNPWYLLLMFVSWIPGLILARIGAEFLD